MKRRVPGGFLDRSYLLLPKSSPKTKKLYKKRGRRLERREGKSRAQQFPTRHPFSLED